jgi:hypothetical protein
MLILPTAVLLEAWETGRDASPGERGLILLGVACPETPAATLADWPVGRRDAALLTLFERLFGPRLSAQSDCPECSAALEMDFPVSTMIAPMPGPASDRYVLEHAGHRVTYRLPTAGDLAAMGQRGTVLDADSGMTRWLLQRCVVDIETNRAGSADSDVPPNREEFSLALLDRSASRIPDEVIAALETAITTTVAAADPLAEIEIELNCPECAASWSAPFDIVSFLWNELDDWASRILGQVHVLASSYGWSESEIVALSPQRRQYYQDLIGP